MVTLMSSIVIFSKRLSLYMITTAKVLLFPDIHKFFTLFAQFFDAKKKPKAFLPNPLSTPKAAPESLQLKYGFFYFFQKIFGTRVSAHGTPSGLLKPPETARRALGTEPPAPWNARQRTWNALGLLEPSGTDPQALLPAHWG